MKICDAAISEASINAIKSQLGRQFIAFARNPEHGEEVGGYTFERIGLCFEKTNVELKCTCEYFADAEMESGIFTLTDCGSDEIPAIREGWPLVKYSFDETLSAIEITTEKVVLRNSDGEEEILIHTPIIALIGATKKLVIVKDFYLSELVRTYLVDKDARVDKGNEWEDAYEDKVYEVTSSVTRFE